MKGQTQQRSTALHGLSSAEAARSRETHGANILTKQKRKSTLRIFLSNLGDPIIRILLGALALNLVLSFRGSDWIET
ncbi:MAG: hypothetical protein E7666_08000, partial [Ruminococcaceae bacterium]|nr:hypothetical protein [Oscillospiraceae bacterium]